MTGDPTVFHKYSPCYENYTIRIADGSLSKVVGTGSVVLSKDLTLNSVLLVPNLDCNLLSISKLTRDMNCVAEFSSNLCEFQVLGSGRTIGSAEACSGFYLLHNNSSLEKQAQTASCAPVLSQSNKNLSLTCNSNNDSEVMLWHYRLGHPNFVYLEKLFLTLFINKNPKFFHCEICRLAKHSRTSYPSHMYKSS